MKKLKVLALALICAAPSSAEEATFLRRLSPVKRQHKIGRAHV